MPSALLERLALSEKKGAIAIKEFDVQKQSIVLENVVTTCIRVMSDYRKLLQRRR